MNDIEKRTRGMDLHCPKCGQSTKSYGHDRCLWCEVEQLRKERDKSREHVSTLREVVKLCDMRDRLDYNDPIENVVEPICELHGYGAVLDCASRLWIKKGIALGRSGEGKTVGPHQATVIEALEKTKNPKEEDALQNTGKNDEEGI